MLTVYIDESGDLGWNFTLPYRSGGSSRHLTIASLCVPPEKKHLPKRLIKELGRRAGLPRSVEMKWSSTSQAAREAFALASSKMCGANPDICLHAITVNKENVQKHIRQDPNKLYNYMIRLSLLDRMAAHPAVTFIPDPRSIKVESGNSLHDYLQIELWFKKGAMTTLVTLPMESHNSANLQFADMLAGLVQSRYEDDERHNFEILRRNITLSTLYFAK
jgi:hypothetical protein